jgi:hypothetical protein
VYKIQYKSLMQALPWKQLCRTPISSKPVNAIQKLNVSNPAKELGDG